MGLTIEYEELSKLENDINRLLVYYKKLIDVSTTVSISKPLAEAIFQCEEKRRSIKLASIFCNVLSNYPDDVIINGIDVLFNPSYQVDVLKILTEAYKRKKYSVIWPGSKEEGKLIYGEEGYQDYKVYLG